MQGLHYRAIDSNGQIQVGYAAAEDEQELNVLLRQWGLERLPASFFQQCANRLRIKPRYAKWTLHSASLFSSQLSQLLEAGVPLIDALSELQSLQQKPQIKSAVGEIVTQLKSGAALSDAMKAQPMLFKPDAIAAVKAGEVSGELGLCLHLLGENQLWQARLVERLKNIMAYPLFAGMCLIGVLLFVLLYLVPAMMPLLEGADQLPAHSEWLIALSQLITNRLHSALIVAGSVLLVIASAYLLFPGLRVGVASAALKNTFGRIRTQYTLARYARTLGLLYSSGIELTEAMRVAQDSVQNIALRLQLNNARRRVLAGDNLANAVAAQPNLPTLFIRMVAAGESAGVLDVALKQSAEQMQCSAQYTLDRIERLLGPVLLSILGLLLLWVASSVLTPIYESATLSGAGW